MTVAMMEGTPMSDVNPCKADNERRQRAFRDATVAERFGNFERSVTFEVGYDHRSHPEACGGGGHGQSGMTMRWILKGPDGATQFCAYMPNWVPGHVNRIGGVQPEGDISVVHVGRTLNEDLMGTDLGYHSPKPQWEGQEQYGRDDCHLLDGGTCYYDGSGLNAEPVLAAFLDHGPHAVWVALARYYAELFGADEAPEVEPF